MVRSQRYTFRYLLLLLFLPVVITAEPRPSNLHITQIASLEAKGSPSSNDLYNLALHHYKLANYYAATADCAAKLTIEAARCYSEDKVRAWGTEYFGALANLQSGNPEEAKSIVASTRKRAGASKELVSLGKLVGRAGNLLSKGELLSVNMLRPTNYWDSLEAVSLIMSFTDNLPKIPVIKDVKEVGGVVFTALIERVKLAMLLGKSDKQAMRDYVNRLDKKPLPQWQIKTSDGTARFSDPMMVKLLSQAHYQLADEDFSRAAIMSGKLRPLNWIRTCYHLGNVDRVDSLLQLAGDNMLLRPYAGWVHSRRGEQAEADNAWDRVVSSNDYKIISELLKVWAEYPDKKEPSSVLRNRLLEMLGGLRDRTSLSKSVKGQRQMLQTYWTVGEWFYRQEIYDSAAFYYGYARVGNDPVSLDNYSTYFCASYFSARIMSGATDFQQEGYQGFLDLEGYFPSAAVVIEPLSTVLQCESIKLRE